MALLGSLEGGITLTPAETKKVNLFYAAPQTLTGPGAASVTTRVTFLAPTAGGNAITLADGTYAGQSKVFHIGATEPGGKSCVITPAHFGTNTSITLSLADAWIELVWDGTNWRWISSAASGVSIS